MSRVYLYGKLSKALYSIWGKFIANQILGLTFKSFLTGVQTAEVNWIAFSAGEAMWRDAERHPINYLYLHLDIISS